MRIYRVVAALATILLPLLPVMYTSWKNDEAWLRGSAPPINLELSQQGAFDPTSSMALYSRDVKINLTLAGTAVENLQISTATIKNVGKSPVTPKDFVEPFSVTVDQPWRIIAVQDSPVFANAARLSWKKISDIKFEAEPTLLNPGDQLSEVVFLTRHDAPDTTADSPAMPVPSVVWGARIVNMASFTIPADPHAEAMKIGTADPLVFVSGFGILVLLFLAAFKQGVYIWVLKDLIKFSPVTRNLVMAFVSTTIISYCSAEAITTYLVPNFFTIMLGTSLAINIPIILLDAFLLTTLAAFSYVKLRRRIS